MTHASTETPSPNGTASNPVPTERELRAAFRRQPHAYLDVGSANLAYYRFGRGPDVVFVHGWPLDSATFRCLVPFLADSFTCHLIDLPGAGQTEWRDEKILDFAEHARTLRKGIDLLGLTKFAFVGHDSGGFVARMEAADDPRVQGLVLGNTEIPGHTPWLVAALALGAKTPIGMPLLRSVMRVPWVRRSSLGFGDCFTDPADVEGAFYELFIEPMLVPGRIATGQAKLLQNLHGGTLEGMIEAHAKIKVPVKLVWGSRDPFFPLAKARPMLKQFGGRAELVEIPEGKLFAHEDHAEAFAAHAKPFLAQCLG